MRREHSPCSMGEWLIAFTPQAKTLLDSYFTKTLRPDPPLEEGKLAKREAEGENTTQPGSPKTGSPSGPYGS